MHSVGSVVKQSIGVKIMTDYNWKPVDDRYPTDRELVACKCGDGSMFLGFCITPYSDCGSIKNWYAYTASTDWYFVVRHVTQYCKLCKKGEEPIQ